MLSLKILNFIPSAADQSAANSQSSTMYMAPARLGCCRDPESAASVKNSCLLEIRSSQYLKELLLYCDWIIHSHSTRNFNRLTKFMAKGCFLPYLQAAANCHNLTHHQQTVTILLIISKLRLRTRRFWLRRGRRDMDINKALGRNTGGLRLRGLLLLN
eukprot:g19284.t1